MPESGLHLATRRLPSLHPMTSATSAEDSSDLPGKRGLLQACAVGNTKLLSFNDQLLNYGIGQGFLSGIWIRLGSNLGNSHYFLGVFQPLLLHV